MTTALMRRIAYTPTVFLTNEIIILKYWLVAHGLLQELAHGLLFADCPTDCGAEGGYDKLCCTCTSYSLVPSLAILVSVLRPHTLTSSSWSIFTDGRFLQLCLYDHQTMNNYSCYYYTCTIIIIFLYMY